MKTTNNKNESTAVPGQWPVIEHSPLVEGKLHRPAMGLIELSTEIVMNAEMRAFLPDCDYGLYSSRVEFGDTADIKGLAAMEAHLYTAAKLLPSLEYLDAIVYGCTSGSMVIGPDQVSALISSARPGVPVFNPISAVIAALKTMNCHRIAVVTPYPHETNQVVNSFLSQNEIDIVNALTFNILSGYAMSRLSPNDFYAAALQVNTEEAEAIFISCTASHLSPILEDLEHAIGKPVVTSNQALVWQCCETTGLHRTDGHGGVLFDYRFDISQ
jgi:maleate isomerase